MVPTISDVSTRLKSGDRWLKILFKGTPGLGYYDRSKLDYNADVMEMFLVDFVNLSSSPVSCSVGDLVIVGGGHAATIVVKAAKNGLLKPSAIAAVAPTWADPLPIVFGRESNMEPRYGLLRGTLRAPQEEYPTSVADELHRFLQEI
ncbi:hypothetical protein AKJ16_DCAP09000 [Drosera capensis]